MLRTYDIDELKEIMASLGQPLFRADQLYKWLHVHNAVSYDEMTDLPTSLRTKLAELYPFPHSEILSMRESADGTRKYVLSFDDGALVETVGIPSPSAKGEEGRLTACLSSQAGCPMGCLFCATGREKFIRNLSAHEILEQAVVVQRDFPQRLSNIVVMGQGEPFLNYEEILCALRVLNSPSGSNIGARHMAVSSCGFIDGIRRFSDEPEQFRLAISLHSAIQGKRDALMPGLSNQPLNRLKKALCEYTKRTGRRITLEYLLLKDVNDRREDMDALLDFCNGLLCHVNLLAMNKVDDVDFAPSKKSTLKWWEGELNKKGVGATIRQSHGSDVAGACGQLANSFS